MSELAILGGSPIRKEPYPEWPVFDDRDLQAVTDAIRSRRWGGYPYPGPYTAEFTRRFAELQGGGYAVAMANGTITMEVALRTANIGWGDEVILPAYTFQATAAAPMAAGAIPVLVDIDPQSYCIDPRSVEAAITPRTRAILPVHLGAQMADMDAIMDIAERHDLIVVEDCAHAHGARWLKQEVDGAHSRGSGTIGHFGSFSLQSSKILTTGEGGILLCRTPELAERAMSIIDCGRPHDKDEKNYTMGANYRWPELQAALGIVAIERFPDQARQREDMASYMDEALSEVSGVRPLKRDPRHIIRSFYTYIFAINEDIFKLDRDVVCAALYAEGIPCDTGYPAMHRYNLFQPHLSRLPVPSAFPEYFEFDKMSFPVAEQTSLHEAIWLEENVFRAGRKGIDDVISALMKIQENSSELLRAARI
jgi:dTDP-4-amino-4,6-dideoxygalactose transaminase